EVLNRFDDFQTFLVRYARRHEKRRSDGLAAGLFSEFVQHGLELGHSLEVLRSDHGFALGNTWVQFPGLDALNSAMQRLDAEDIDDVEVIAQGLLEAEASLRDSLDQVLGQLDATPASEALVNLRDAVDQRVRTLSSDVSDFQKM
ncbi:MAG: hypothetical protein KDA61_17900, partial [Planctomycetales bacterium]|nr:hypothetical protein [Planctomycetales bacterium]